MKRWVSLLVLAIVSLRAPVAPAADDALPPGYEGFSARLEFPGNERELESMRARGDLEAQRRHMWQVFAELQQPEASTGLPLFLSWYGAGEAFADGMTRVGVSVPRTLHRSFSLPRLHPKESRASTAPPLIIRAQYNIAAYRHIRDSGLSVASRLTDMSSAIRTSSEVAGTGTGSAGPAGGSIPVFPRDSVVLKTVWWPVPADGVVALPVWDAGRNPARAGGNDYPTWARAVAVSLQETADSRADVELMGRRFASARRFSIQSFIHIVLDRRMALDVMTDPIAAKAASMLLGRPLRESDALVLVAMHVATREIADWVWGTLWWHDNSDMGPFAKLRPLEVSGPGRNYLMNVAFDTQLPREADGAPHVAYNPWLEARFADRGNGGGVVSNCMSCHRRASLAMNEPFVVTRGSQDLPAVTPGAKPDVRTSSLWSIPLQAH